jgi:hypothetical protein
LHNRRHELLALFLSASAVFEAAGEFSLNHAAQSISDAACVAQPVQRCHQLTPGLVSLCFFLKLFYGLLLLLIANL